MSKKVLVDLSMKLSADSAQLRKGMEESKREMQKMRKSSEDVGKKITQAFAAIAVAVGTIKRAFKEFDDVIKSTQTTADKYEQVLGGIAEAKISVQQAIATSDFSNFIDNVREAYQAGKEYIEILDELADRGRAVSIGTAQAEYEIAVQRGIASNTALSDNERLAAAKEMQRLASDQINREKDVKQGLINAELNLLQKRFDLTDKQLGLLRTYTTQYDLLSDNVLKEAQGFIEAFEAVGKRPEQQMISQGVLINNPFYEAELKHWEEKKIQATQFYDLLTNEQKAYADLMLQLGGGNMNLYTDAMRDALANAERDLYSVMTKFQIHLNTAARYEGRVSGKSDGIGTGGAYGGGMMQGSTYDWSGIDYGQMGMSWKDRINQYTKQENEAIEPYLDSVLEKFNQVNDGIIEGSNAFNVWEGIAVGAAQSVVDAFFNMAQGIEVSIESILRNLLRMITMQLVQQAVSGIFLGAFTGGIGGAAMMGGGAINMSGMSGLGLTPGGMSMGGFKNGSLDINVHGFIGNQGIYLAGSRATQRRNIVES